MVERFGGVLARVGLGGAGKTVVAVRYPDQLTRAADLPRPDGLLLCVRLGRGVVAHVLGQALAAQQRVRAARKVLRHTLSLRRRIGDPQAEATARLRRCLR